ncbi:MAG: putative hydroxymethylpyrimidine transporter CytX [Chloroflexi bacterium]|nr:putative hydroxymethylpyrimidine transporter CytX [Chloroflexota bacterium]
MSLLSDVWRRVLPKVQAPPEWGIEPVPKVQRKLGFLDYFVLWGDLGIGLLVLLAGSFLVPGLSFSGALLATLIGSVLGCLLLALVGMIGSDNGIPTMVLLRPVLGVRGSYLPSALNVLQLVGWTIFEFVIMGYAANVISRTVFGVSSIPLWTAVFAAIVILMGIGGPVGVVRQWLEKFAVWVVLGTTAWLTWHLLSTTSLAELLSRPGNGSLTLGIGVDLVIAMPISWLPLVADYNRFARKTGTAFWGTFAGYLITNVWFYALGATVLLASGIAQEPKGFVSAMAITAGWIALLILLVDETDNAWADLYSSAVSMQNVFPRVKQRWLILGLGILAYLAALVIDITQYENFLFLTGSFFIPLFGILVSDYFILRRRPYQADNFYQPPGRFWGLGSVNLWGMIAWVAGIAAYNLTNPSTLGAFIPGWARIVPQSLTVFGGSLPSFIAALVIYTVLAGVFMRRKEPGRVTAHKEN